LTHADALIVGTGHGGTQAAFACAGGASIPLKEIA
jgi:hypothetical protein